MKLRNKKRLKRVYKYFQYKYYHLDEIKEALEKFKAEYDK